jgi:hypothetical protein
MTTTETTLFQTVKELCESAGFDYDKAERSILKACQENDDLRAYILQIGARAEARHHSNEENRAIDSGAIERGASKARDRDNAVIADIAERHVLDMRLSNNLTLRECSRKQVAEESAIRKTLAEGNLRDARFFDAVVRAVPAGIVGKHLSDAAADALWARLAKS